MAALMTSPRTVVDFDRGMIEAYLREHGMRFMRDHDGDYMLDLGYDPMMDCSLSLILVAGGSERAIYEIHAISDRKFSRNEWGKAVAVCNTWNKERRWPKAYLYLRDPARDTVGYVHLECQISLTAGVHKALFEDFTDTALQTAVAFWSWAHTEQGL